MLRQHVKNVHEGERREINFKCRECGKGFHNEKAWTEHKAVPHNVPCTLCSVRFTTKKAQMHHLRADHQAIPAAPSVKHLDVKVTCTECGQEFRKYYIKIHMKKAHPEAVVVPGAEAKSARKSGKGKKTGLIVTGESTVNT